MAIRSKLVRSEFPIFKNIHGLVYLDSAAMCQVPEAVLAAMRNAETTARANPHRSMYALAETATECLEQSRSKIAGFIGAKQSCEIIFTKNCTESINLIAKTWAKKNVTEKDTVLLSVLEHHSDIVPWLQLREETGCRIEWIPVSETGELDEVSYAKMLREHAVKLVAVTGQSNVLGIRPDVVGMIRTAHEAGAKVSVDAAQLIGHSRVNVAELDCDFLCFSGHKLYGPQGIGVLYAKRELLEEMPPFLGGGMMIRDVTKEGFSCADIPQKFEAGTQPLAQAAGLAAAIDWLTRHEWSEIERHEEEVFSHAMNLLGSIDTIRILGPGKNGNASSCIAFTHAAIHPHDLTDLLGRKNICLRAGHHCARPLHTHLGIAASVRLSIGIYNTIDDIDRCCEAIERIRL